MNFKKDASCGSVAVVSLQRRVLESKVIVPLVLDVKTAGSKDKYVMITAGRRVHFRRAQGGHVVEVQRHQHARASLVRRPMPSRCIERSPRLT